MEHLETKMKRIMENMTRIEQITISKVEIKKQQEEIVDPAVKILVSSQIHL